MNLQHFIHTLQVCYVTAALLCLIYLGLHPYPTVNVPVMEVSLAAEETETIPASEPAIEEIEEAGETEEAVESATATEEPAQEVSEPEILPEEPVEKTQYTYVASHNTGKLFIRNGPSLDCDIIGFMKPGSTGGVIELGDEWSLIQYKDTQGYTFNEYLTFIPVEK